MVDKKGIKTKLEDGGKTLKDAGEKVNITRQSLNDSINKITSPFEQKKQQLDAAINKAEEPFQVMVAKQQQAKNAMEEAQNKADAAKKILNAKELAYNEGKNRTDSVMSDATSGAQRAKGSIENRQQEFQKASEFVKSLIAKIGSREKAKSESASGGKT